MGDPEPTWDLKPPESGMPISGPGVADPEEEPTGSSSTTPPSLIFAEVEPELRRFLWGVVRNSAQVDDLIQATYLKVMERGAAAQAATAKGWLFRVAYREALIVKRRAASRDRTTQHLATLPLREAPRPDESLIRAETIQAVRQAMKSLSEPQRKVVNARMTGDQTFAEIAAEAGLPLGTVLTHMRRALEKLRRVLDPGE